MASMLRINALKNSIPKSYLRATSSTFLFCCLIPSLASDKVKLFESWVFKPLITARVVDDTNESSA